MGRTICLASTLPRLQSLRFLLLESSVDELTVATVDYIMAWIVASADIVSTPDLFEHFRQSFVNKCRLFYDLRVPYFE
ncbi:hypothetical protein TNCV_3213611 [Trichonephila clavipes]|nr:hypothetical protein TNCV_3213611 [Trichonephila clavipes]